jgi:hypothetical protein
LLAHIRKADAAPATTPAPKKDPEVVDSIKSLSNDAEEVSAFLSNLLSISQDRTATYLKHIKAYFPRLWKELKTVAAEEFAPPQAEEDDEEPMDVPPPPAAEDEEFAEEPEAEEEEQTPPAAQPEDIEEEVPAAEDEEPVPSTAEDEEPEEPQAQEDTVAPPYAAEDEEIEEPAAEGEPPVEAPPAAEDEESEEEPEAQTEEEVAVEPVVDPEELEQKEGAAIDMVLFGAGTNNPHWSVFADGKPLAEIQLQDQENPVAIQDVFTSEDYPKHVSEACASSIGIKGTLESLRARWYHGVVTSGKAVETAREAASQDMETEYASRLASLKEDLLNTINLAITASNKGRKGLFVENTLKNSIVEVMRQAGVINARQVASEVWVEASQQYMTNILKVAEKWMGYSPETMSEVTKEILGTDVMPDAEEVDPEDEVEEAMGETDAPSVPQLQQTQARKAGMGMVNVPIRTATVRAHMPEDYRHDTSTRVASALSRRMGMRRTGGR